MTGKETTLRYQHFRRAVLYSITCFLLTQSVFAGGQSVFTFIRNDASARFAGIGGSAVAMRHDPALIFYNPAGLYGLQTPQVSLSYFNNTAGSARELPM
jgi:hypothetical protein